jgi:hypothetical protein
MKRNRSKYTAPRDRDTFSEPKPLGKSSGGLNLTPIAMFAFAAIFILGVGVGIAFSSTASVNPQNVASREFIDRSAPNTELCVQYGASAMVTDLRVFLTLNPFSVFVTQPTMKPGCVLRQNNWSLLEQKNLVTSEQVRDCKRRMNTFGFTGDLNNKADIECIYQNDGAKNLFLNQPGNIGPQPETDNF